MVQKIGHFQKDKKKKKNMETCRSVTQNLFSATRRRSDQRGIFVFSLFILLELLPPPRKQTDTENIGRVGTSTTRRLKTEDAHLS